MQKKIVLLQPSYIPWLGYFDQIHQADLFVFYDDTQYTRRDWRNRNKIKNSNSQEQLLTIPVETKGRYHAKINEIPIKENTPWREEHLKAIKFNYAKAPFFKDYFPKIEQIISPPNQQVHPAKRGQPANQPGPSLSTYNIETTKALANLLGITNTEFTTSSELNLTYESPNQYIIEICKKLNATHYLTGEKAQNYLDESLFTKHSITLEYQRYKHPEYSQQWGDFIPYLSIVDLILNEGPKSLQILSN